jgi:hypothetical protein
MKQKIKIPANTLKEGDTLEIKLEIDSKFDPTKDNYVTIKVIPK